MPVLIKRTPLLSGREQLKVDWNGYFYCSKPILIRHLQVEYRLKSLKTKLVIIGEQRAKKAEAERKSKISETKSVIHLSRPAASRSWTALKLETVFIDCQNVLHASVI